MAVLIEFDVPATSDQYDEIDGALDIQSNPPDGFIAHTAEDAGGTMRIRDVWESPEAYGTFAESRLGPTIAQAMGDDAPPAPQPKITELHNFHTA